MGDRLTQSSYLSAPVMTERTPKRNWRRVTGGMIIGFLVSASLLIIVLRDIRWHLLGTSLRHAQPIPILIAAIGFASAYAVVALRWKALVGSDRLRFVTAFEVLNIGLVCNVILPARGGDMVRVVMLNQRERIRMSVGLTSVLLEKLFDVAALVFLILPAIAIVDLPRWVVLSAMIGVVGVIAGFTFCIILARCAWEFGTIPLITRLPARIHLRIVSFLTSFRDGLRALFTWKRMLMVCFLSLLVWAINCIAAYLVFSGLHITGISFGATFVVIGIMNLGLIIPSSPGNVGTYEFLGVSALALFHVTRESALEFALVVHMLTLLIVLILGIASMARLGYSLMTVPRNTAEATA